MFQFPLAVLDISPTGFQIQTLWRPIFSMNISQTGAHTMGSCLRKTYEVVIFLSLVDCHTGASLTRLHLYSSYGLHVDFSEILNCRKSVLLVFSASESCSVVSDSLRPHGLYSPWDSPGQNTGVGSLSLLQGIFPIQGLNPGLPHCRWILYQQSHKGSPSILEWVAYPFSSGSSQASNQTGVSCIAGGFFTNWASLQVFLKDSCSMVVVVV